MKAFKNSPSFKEAFLDQLKWHQDHDRIIKGTYGEYTEDGEVFKACAIGCSMHSLARMLNIAADTSNHAKMAELLDIPAIITYMEDSMFESLPTRLAIEWPYKFAKAIPVGADLSMVGPKWIHWRLSYSLPFLTDPDVAAERKDVISMYDKVLSGEEIPVWRWVDAKLSYTDRIASYAAYAAAKPDAVAALIASRWGDSEFLSKQTSKLLKLMRSAPVEKPDPDPEADHEFIVLGAKDKW